MDLIWTKVIVALLFGFIRLFFGLLPIKLYSYLKIWEKGADGHNHVNKEREERAEIAITLVQSFGGGVLFATCFLHMMPEVYHAVNDLEEHYELEKGYPRSQMIICIGFFMIYFVEEVSQFMISKANDCEKCFVVKSASPSNISTISNANKITPQLIKNNEKVFEKRLSFEINNKSCEDIKSIEIKQCKKFDDQKSIDSGLEKSNEELNFDIPMPTSERDLILQLEKSPRRLLRCCMITMALSFHAIFEGIAIGLQNSVTNIWYLFVAISIHSVTILFCVGVQLLFSHKRTIVIFYFIFVLSITSPLGVLIGLAVTTHTAEESIGTAIASALLEGLSAGTLLYITFFEVLSKEKERTTCRFKRGLCVIVGFIIMAILQMLE